MQLASERTKSTTKTRDVTEGAVLSFLCTPKVVVSLVASV